MYLTNLSAISKLEKNRRTETRSFENLFNKLSCVVLDCEVDDKLVCKSNSNMVYLVYSKRTWQYDIIFGKN